MTSNKIMQNSRDMKAPAQLLHGGTTQSLSRLAEDHAAHVRKHTLFNLLIQGANGAHSRPKFLLHTTVFMPWFKYHGEGQKKVKEVNEVGAEA